MLRSHSRSEDPAEPRPGERAVGIGRSVTTYPDLEVPVPVSGSGYQGRRGSDTLAPAGGNSDPPDVSRKAAQSHLAPGRAQRKASVQRIPNLVAANAGPRGQRRRGSTELKPALPTPREAHCWAWDRPIIWCHPAIYWLVSEGSEAVRHSASWQPCLSGLGL